MQPRYPNAPRRAAPRHAADPLATALGWLSLGLGTVEVVAPGAVARCLGMGRRRGLIQFYGFREILTGLGILATDRPGPWLWARVAGDLLDLATLGPGLDRDNPRRNHVGLALGTVAAVTVLDFACARACDAGPGPGPYVAPDYSGRSGFPRPPAEMRGVARAAPAPNPAAGPEPSPTADV